MLMERMLVAEVEGAVMMVAVAGLSVREAMAVFVCCRF
jgi:hypothetical protein